MTFREAIQIQIKTLHKVWENADNLRDIAGQNEWNHVRRELRKIWEPLQALDNRMSDEVAAFQLKGDYSVHVTKEDI